MIVTTVGEGDKYPVTPRGRVVGVFLLSAAVVLFATLTGDLANAFLRPHVGGDPDALEPGAPADDPAADLTEVVELPQQQQAESAAIPTRPEKPGGDAVG